MRGFFFLPAESLLNLLFFLSHRIISSQNELFLIQENNWKIFYYQKNAIAIMKMHEMQFAFVELKFIVWERIKNGWEIILLRDKFKDKLRNC